MHHAGLFQPALRISAIDITPELHRVKITARKDGLAGAMLALFGQDNHYSLAVSPRGFQKRTAGIVGEEMTSLDPEHISGTVFTLRKPVEVLFMLPGILAVGVIQLAANHAAALTLGLVFLGLAFALLLYYLFARRRVTVGVLSDAGTLETLRLKASNPEREELKEALKVMMAALALAREGDQEPERSPQPLEKYQPPPPHEDMIIACPRCTAQVQILASQRGRKLRCPTCQGVFQA